MVEIQTQDEWVEAVMAERSAIYRYAYSRLGPNLAEDVLSATLAAAWRSRCSFSGAVASSALRAWLLGIATNVIRQYRDAEQKWLTQRLVGGAPDAAMWHDEHERIDARIDAAQARGALLDALNSLDPADRDLVVLTVVQERSYDEAAQIL